ncbi:hypothetical protein FOXG_18777 [Fusarium oxysporum f. sp. lycopersici 4287]|uniref:Uncharacterized protein n=2 Tax=Fusarium oxysporum TaxID=5507 RepID=A0A0J9UNK6_FUSO4|nr:hypothetical protein FOXG_18777 [Fusarium oxysporum f. sp. lycopersici 4287]EXK44096.1 hypothetical protein FOMG_02925 [Fusarium oxysporum f. sp. melonis 26406]KNB00835.1 hypothetical protein FOXG_18777 [Fusarium oxysporum f. sp. lycopersici 4287]
MRALPLVSRPPVNIGHGLDYTGLDWIVQGLRCPMPSPLEDLGPRVGVVIETGRGMNKRGERETRERGSLINPALPCLVLPLNLALSLRVPTPTLFGSVQKAIQYSCNVSCIVRCNSS